MRSGTLLGMPYLRRFRARPTPDLLSFSGSRSGPGGVRQLVLTGPGSAWQGEREHLAKKLAPLGPIDLVVCKPIRNESEEYRAGRINELLVRLSPDVLYVHAEWSSAITTDVVRRLKRPPCTVLLTFDDNMWHDKNRQIATMCDLVALADPLQAMVYQSYGLPTVPFHLETASMFPESPDSTKAVDSDVLVYGRLDPARVELVERIQSLLPERFQIRVHERSPEFSAAALRRLVSSSRLVLNFAGFPTDALSGFAGSNPPPFENVLGYKGRPVEVGLCGALCVSEFSPSLALAFPGGVLPFFRSPAEAAALIESLLSDEAALLRATERFSLFVHEHYGDAVEAQRLERAVQSILEQARR